MLLPGLLDASDAYSGRSSVGAADLSSDGNASAVLPVVNCFASTSAPGFGCERSHDGVVTAGGSSWAADARDRCSEHFLRLDLGAEGASGVAAVRFMAGRAVDAVRQVCVNGLGTV